MCGQQLKARIFEVAERDINRDSSEADLQSWQVYKIYEVDPLTCPKCSGKMK